MVGSFINMAAILGGAIAQPLVGYILHLTWNGRMEHSVPDYIVTNYHVVLFILPIAALLGLFCNTRIFRS